jgi:hypothetical protein
MSKIYDEIDIFEIECNASVQFFYKSFPPRVEECHGLHEFNEDELINKKLLHFFVTLEDGTTIDLRDRLTSEEVDKIISAKNIH